MSLVSAFQIPYREAREGFWGEQTSTLNWCEEVSPRDITLKNTCEQMLTSQLGLQHHILLC